MQFHFCDFLGFKLSFSHITGSKLEITPRYLNFKYSRKMGLSTYPQDIFGTFYFQNKLKSPGRDFEAQVVKGENFLETESA